MELTNYLTPLWVNALVMLGVMLIGGGIICGLFALGLKRGINNGASGTEGAQV